MNSAGQAALTWFDSRDGNEEVYLAVFPLAGFVVGAPPPAQRLTHSPGTSIGAYLAWNGDRLAVAWCDTVDGQGELYVQLFDARGTPAGPAHRVSRTTADSLIPSIRADGRGFRIAWNEYGPGRGLGHAEDASSAVLTARLR